MYKKTPSCPLLVISPWIFHEAELMFSLCLLPVGASQCHYYCVVFCPLEVKQICASLTGTEKEILHRSHLHAHNTEVHLSDAYLPRKYAAIFSSKISIPSSTKNEFRTLCSSC